ncbi:MAG: BCCT family transporter, partial [Desulfovibrionales bacterium]|nr:BCCT family transporter [Desulfovibrionales bacterium]
MAGTQTINENVGKGKFDPVLFWSTLLIVSSIIFWGYTNLATFEKVLSNMHGWVTVHFRWFFMYFFTISLVFLYYIAFSKYGSMKLGKMTDK